MHLDIMQSPFGMKVLAKLLTGKRVSKVISQDSEGVKLVENYHVWGPFTRIVTLMVLH